MSVSINNGFSPKTKKPTSPNFPERSELDYAEAWFASNMERSKAIGEFCEIADITPAIAQVFLDRNIGNRPIVVSGINKWIDALRAGDWTLNGENFKISICGLLNDGQHRAKAIIETGISMRTFVAWGLERDSRETVDLHSKRTAAHILSMDGVKNSNLVAAVVRIHVNMRLGVALRSYRSAKELQREIDDYPDLSEYRGTAIKAANTFHQSAGLFYAIHCIASRWHTPDRPFGLTAGELEGQPPDSHYRDNARRLRLADEFFSHVASTVGLTDEHHPSAALNKRLQANLYAKAKLPITEVAALVIKAWNAFSKNETIKLLRWGGAGDKPEPFPRVL